MNVWLSGLGSLGWDYQGFGWCCASRMCLCPLFLLQGRMWSFWLTRTGLFLEMCLTQLSPKEINKGEECHHFDGQHWIWKNLLCSYDGRLAFLKICYFKKQTAVCRGLQGTSWIATRVINMANSFGILGCLCAGLVFVEVNKGLRPQILIETVELVFDIPLYQAYPRLVWLFVVF